MSDLGIIENGAVLINATVLYGSGILRTSLCAIRARAIRRWMESDWT